MLCSYQDKFCNPRCYVYSIAYNEILLAITNENDECQDLGKGGSEMSGGCVSGGGFALLVVLFILLVIIGASWL